MVLQVDLLTPFHAAGMACEQPLWKIRELRWLTSEGTGVMNNFGVAEVALRLLLVLAEMQPASTAGGQVLHPLPRVHRTLAQEASLPHLCQVREPGAWI